MTCPPVTIIAEVGVNHNGDPGLARDLVHAAADCGADYVKFQTFRARDLVAARAPKAAYQDRAIGADAGQLEMLSGLELSREEHLDLVSLCRERGIGFLSSPFDVDSLVFLTRDLALDTVKLGSGELSNGPLIHRAASTGANLILSTGMASLSDVEAALGAFAHGALAPGTQPGRRSFAQLLLDPEAWKVLEARVSLLHCTTDYPAPVASINLRAMDTLRQAFGLTVGYSDHTEGGAISVAAVARGARIIEKHLTLDRDLPGPDHRSSLEPGPFARMVADIRDTEAALGSARKQPSAEEWETRLAARKSLLAARDLPKGHVLTPEDITIKRPGGGRSPMEYWEAIGTVLPHDLASEDYIP
jgi:N-acetylneuraminate synthase